MKREKPEWLILCATLFVISVVVILSMVVSLSLSDALVLLLDNLKIMEGH